MKDKKEKSPARSSLGAFEALFQLKQEFPECPEYSSLTEKDKAFFIVFLLRFRENLKKTNMYSFSWYQHAREIRNEYAHLTDNLSLQDFEFISHMYNSWINDALFDLYKICEKIFGENPSIKKYSSQIKLDKDIIRKKSESINEKLIFPLPENLLKKFSSISIKKNSELKSDYKKIVRQLRHKKNFEKVGVWTFQDSLTMFNSLYKNPEVGKYYDEYNPETCLLNNLRLYSKNYEDGIHLDFSEIRNDFFYYVLKLPEGITDIDSLAFDFKFLSKVTRNPKLKKHVFSKFRFSMIILPDSLLSVSQGAFANLPDETKIIFGDSIQTISRLAFYNSSSSCVKFPLNKKLNIFEGAFDLFPPDQKSENIKHTTIFYDGVNLTNALNFENLENHFTQGIQPDFPLDSTFDFFKALSDEDLHAYSLLGNKVFIKQTYFQLKNKRDRINDILMDAGHENKYISLDDKNYLEFSKKLVLYSDGKMEEKTGTYYLCSAENFCSEYYENSLISMNKHKIYFVRGIRENGKIKGGIGYEISGNRPVMVKFI